MSEGSGAALSDGRSLTPAEARQDAHDRLVGQRTLLALRIVAIIAAVLFGTLGILEEFGVGDSQSLGLGWGLAFALLGAAGVVAVIVCRRPARRQVHWLREAIIAAGWLPIVIGGIGLAAELNAVLANLAMAVALVTGLTTLVLLYVWRAR